MHRLGLRINTDPRGTASLARAIKHRLHMRAKTLLSLILVKNALRYFEVPVNLYFKINDHLSNNIWAGKTTFFPYFLGVHKVFERPKFTMPHDMSSRIEYSEKYLDDTFEYR